MSQLIDPNVGFIDNATGAAVALGTAYFGLPFEDPETDPKAPYSDRAMTTAVSATQALTAAGKLSARLYLSGAYSLTVRDAAGDVVFSYDYVTGVNDGDAESLTFTQAGTGAVSRTVQSRLEERISVKDFGAVGDGVTDDSAEIQAALDEADARGGAEVYFPPAVYYCAATVISVDGDGVFLNGYGATLKDARLRIESTATDTSVHGLKVTDSTSTNGWYTLEVLGTRFLLQDLTLDKTPTTGGVMGYFRRQCSFGTIRGLKSFGSNGFFISGHDLTFTDFEVESKGIDGVSGTDDCFVMKSGDSTNASVQTYNITITGGNVRGFYNILAIGTEIGQYAVDGDYSNYVKNVTVTGVNAYNCVTLAYIKPGAGSGDYRHGLVENINMSNCNLENDLPMINWPFHIRAGRGAILRNVNISNCNVVGRCDGTSLTHSLIDISGMNLGASATIEDVTFENITGRDLYGGVANSGPTPGEPFDWAIRVNRTSAANDTIQRAKFKNVKHYGTEQGGIVFENSPQGPIEFYDCDLLETGVNPAAGSYRGITGLTSSTECVIKNTKIDPANTQLPAGATTFSASADVDVVVVGSSAAGTGLVAPIWTAPVDAYVWKIELIDGTGITQDNTNYLTFTVRNMGTASDLPTANTTIATGINLAANTVVAMSSTSYTTAPAYFTKGSVMRLTSANSGSGQALSNMRARIHYMAYGR